MFQEYPANGSVLFAPTGFMECEAKFVSQQVRPFFSDAIDHVVRNALVVIV
jgi:hypothetical protein